MKKLLGIVVLGLLWCNVGVAESFCEKYPENDICKKKLYSPLNDLLKDGYKITSEELVKGENWLVTIFVLKKRSSIVTCKVDHFYKTTTCRAP